MNDNERNCRNCQFAFFIDFGYSNYTVEGTNFICGLEKHPGGEFDRWYGKEPKLKFAEDCNFFCHGEPVEIDVDRENIPKLTVAQHILWKKIDT